MITLLSLLGLGFASLAASMFNKNLPLFSNPDHDSPGHDWANQESADQNPRGPEQVATQVSVLIPARDEQDGIAASIHAALASVNVTVEVVVLDDQSSDQTFTIVQQIAAKDDRVRCERSRSLPDGWNGKQHACFQLSAIAKYDRLVFLDADVRLKPTGLSRMSRYKDLNNVALLSAFPRQETGTLMERLIIPMMHYILLCYLPIWRMRESNSPGYASGCGQLFMADLADYRHAGTHQAIAASRHDGLKLPKAFRQAKLSTDVIDGTQIATCRMYQSGVQVVRGALKNATEGIANIKLIVPFSILLIGGSLLPIITLTVAIDRRLIFPGIVSTIAAVLGHLPRFRSAIRFRQSFAGAIFHSLAVAIFVMLQWIALVQSLFGFQVSWRGRD